MIISGIKFMFHLKCGTNNSNSKIYNELLIERKITICGMSLRENRRERSVFIIFVEEKKKKIKAP